MVETAYPRSWAFTLLGIHEYLRRLGGDQAVTQVQSELGDRLYRIYRNTQSSHWRWFEDRLTYANAKLPHALIATGHRSGRQEWIDAGLESLEWLMELQRAPAGHFRPIGIQRLLRAGRRAGALRSAADRDSGVRLGVPRGLPRDP